MRAYELPPNLLKGTNCTISLGHFWPPEPKRPPSPSSSTILAKSELPMPTIMMDVGS